MSNIIHTGIYVKEMGVALKYIWWKVARQSGEAASWVQLGKIINLVGRNKSDHLIWDYPMIGFETNRSLFKSNIMRSHKPEKYWEEVMATINMNSESTKEQKSNVVK